MLCFIQFRTNRPWLSKVGDRYYVVNIWRRASSNRLRFNSCLCSREWLKIMLLYRLKNANCRDNFRFVSVIEHEWIQRIFMRRAMIFNSREKLRLLVDWSQKPRQDENSLRLSPQILFNHMHGVCVKEGLHQASTLHWQHNGITKQEVYGRLSWQHRECFVITAPTH